MELVLNDGSSMPQIAFGLYLVKDEECAACVSNAVTAGYRHFDGAAFYDNEAAVGAALPADAWYTTKVWTTDCRFEDAVNSIKRSHAEIGRTIDLALVHWPVPGAHVEMYKALVHCRDELGLVRRVGLSNYTPEDYEALLASGAVVGAPPVVNQIEVSPFLYRKEAVDYFQGKGIVVQAFKPLQRGAALGIPASQRPSHRAAASLRPPPTARYPRAPVPIHLSPHTRSAGGATLLGLAAVAPAHTTRKSLSGPPLPAQRDQDL